MSNSCLKEGSKATTGFFPLYLYLGHWPRWRRKRRRNRGEGMEFLIYGAQEGKGKEESESLRWSPIKGDFLSGWRISSKNTFSISNKICTEAFLQTQTISWTEPHTSLLPFHKQTPPPPLHSLLHLSLYPSISLRSSATETTTKGGRCRGDLGCDIMWRQKEMKPLGRGSACP